MLKPSSHVLNYATEISLFTLYRSKVELYVENEDVTCNICACLVHYYNILMAVANYCVLVKH